MKKLFIGTILAAILAVLAACGGTEGNTSNANTAPSASTHQEDHNDQDIAFAQMMIPHHQQAVEMANMALERDTENPKVKDLATRIRDAQDPEIQQLTDMLKKWGAPATPTMSDMPGMEHEPGMDMHGMEGVMTADEMQELGQASGAEFDRLWVTMMIKHHQGAVDMAKTELDKGVDAEAKALAQKIIDAQDAEIREMQTMLPQ